MASFRQVVGCDISKMGTKKNYCLQNTRLAFGIPPKYADAKAAMEANKAQGTLHDISTLPRNCAVPVFFDTGNPYGHVTISVNGDFYSDGKHLTTLAGMTCQGWAETLNGVRVVEEVPETAPATSSNTTIEAGRYRLVATIESAEKI